MLEMGEQFRAVLPVLPLAEHLVHEAFGELRGCRVGQQLQIDQVLDEVPVTGHDAYTQPRRQRLGETVEVDDAVELVQTGETRGWSRVTRTVDVVFDDEKAVPLGKLQQPERSALRDAESGRVVHDRGREEQLRVVRPSQVLHLLQVGTAAGPGHSVNRGAEGSHVAEAMEVAGVVDENHVAWPNQIPADEVDSSADAIGEQNLLPGRLDPEFRQPATHVLPQRGVSPRITVTAEATVETPARNLPHGPIEAAILQPARRHPADAGTMPVTKLMGLLANQPENVRRLVEPRPPFIGLGRRRQPADEESEPCLD